MVHSKEERIRSANDEVVGRGNLEVVDEVFAADHTLHTGGKDYRGPPFVKKFIGQLRAAIPDLRVVSIEILLETDDTVAWRRTQA